MGAGRDAGMSFEVVQIGDATLYCGDCMEVLPTLGKVDAVITDPPYGIGADSSMHKTSGVVVGHGHRRVAKRTYENTDWDNAPPSKEVIDSIQSVAPIVIIFGGNYFALPPSKCWLVWDKKTNGNFADCELAWTNLNKPVRRLELLWNGFARAGNEERFDHPTQKPIALMAWCIEQAGNPQTILDPFMGSGTTGVAAVQLGRKFIGIERERKYFDIACKRIEQAVAQGQLFAPEPPKQEQADIFGEAA
jgi:site-specific DNA-methyltransferase (adenine-specific)/modification methylase